MLNHPRKRHLKCDETKPACQRCLKRKGHCEGYESSGTVAPKPRTRWRDSESASETSQSDTTASPPSDRPETYGGRHALVCRCGGMLMDPDYNSTVFRNGLEKLYFDNWMRLAPSLGGGCFKSRLWSSTIPQLSTVEPAVRYAALAVGALATAAFPLRLAGPAVDAAGDAHYGHALAFFGRALRLVGTERRPDPEARVRAAVLACLLFVCFETLHDHRAAAVRHINHGLQILEHFLASRAPPAAASGFSAVTTRSPSPYVLEDEVMQAFQRLDVQASSMGLWRPRRAGSTAAVDRAPPADPRAVVPGAFADLEEARRWWDPVQRWLQEYPRQTRLRLERERALRRRGDADELDLCDLPAARTLQARYLGYLEAWHGGFVPLHAAAVRDRGNNGGEGPYLQALSLRLQYLVQWIGVQTVWHSDYRMMHRLTAHFREVNRLAAELLPRLREGGGVFTLDNGPCTALFFTALKCRDAAVREEGIALLERYPRKDGFWDTRALAAVARRNRAVELENETGEDLKIQCVPRTLLACLPLDGLADRLRAGGGGSGRGRRASSRGSPRCGCRL